MTTSMTHALIYTRVSTIEQGINGLSLDAQLDACRRYIAGKGWLIGAELQDIMSGMKDDRPAYQQLLGEVRNLRATGEPVAVVVNSLDRFGRRLLERVRSRQEFKALGVAVHSVRDNGEVSNLQANIMASVAEEEAELAQKRTKETRDKIVAKGWAPGGHVTFGYRLRPATDAERKLGSPKSVLAPDPERAPIARQAFERVAGGESVRSVARWLSSLPETVREGRRFSFRAVRPMLDSRTYIGQFPDGSRGNWEPLIDPQTWQVVQDRIALHRKLPRQASQRYLLSGFMRCPKCGGRMAGGPGGNPPRWPRYSCAAPCRFTASTAKLDAAVLDEVAAILEAVTSSDSRVMAAAERAWRTLGQSADDQAGVRKAHEAAADKARERIKRLALLYADGEIDRAGYNLGREQAGSDLEAAETELARLEPAKSTPPLPPLHDVLRQVGGWRSALMQGSTGVQRDVLAVLIERVIPRKIAYGKFRPEIEWTELGAALKQLAERQH